jgi:crotonobetainyl-CoA:carnitine CoA-transferase CaiB-like acyl-CoA transferase
MMQYAVTGKAAKPMPNRISAWAIYDVFEVADGEKIFLAVVSDTQWKIFCDAFKFDDLYGDQTLATNNLRVVARPTLLPEIKKRLLKYTAAEISAIFESNGLPFAPITRPDQLFEDPHLLATGGLAPIQITDGPNAGMDTLVPLLPLMMDGERLGVRTGPPKSGENSADILDELGFSAADISKFTAAGVIGT